MYSDSPPPDPTESYAKDPNVIAAVKKFTAALDASNPHWRSQLSPADKFICGHKSPIDPARLHLPPEQQ